MNRKLLYVVAACLLLITLVVVPWQMNPPHAGDKVAAESDALSHSQQATAQDMSPTRIPGAANPQRIDAEHKEDVQNGLVAIVEGLKQMGAKEVLPIADELKAAVANGNSGVMLRAFHEAIYGRFAKMNEAIPAIKAHLESPEPYVRHLAAETLLRVGDGSGVPILVDIINSKDAFPQGERDLRISASHALAKYGITSAEGAIFDLYKRTSGSGLLSDLATLRSENLAGVLQQTGYYGNKHSIERYGIVGAEIFTPQIATTFEQTSDSATKNAAAWALARMGGRDQYVNHLMKPALAAIEAQPAGSEASYNESTEALRFLGSIHSPAAVHVLEKALDSQNPIAVRYAIVNLLFNQPGGSERAKQVVIRELNGQQRMIGSELLMQIASKLDDPQVRAAAQASDQRSGGDRWRFWGTERSDWPIQNWIYDYVVALN